MAKKKPTASAVTTKTTEPIQKEEVIKNDETKTEEAVTSPEPTLEKTPETKTADVVAEEKDKSESQTDSPENATASHGLDPTDDATDVVPSSDNLNKHPHLVNDHDGDDDGTFSKRDDYGVIPDTPKRGPNKPQTDRIDKHELAQIRCINRIGNAIEKAQRNGVSAASIDIDDKFQEGTAALFEEELKAKGIKMEFCDKKGSQTNRRFLHLSWTPPSDDASIRR